MAKTKTKQEALSALVGTQRSALQALKTKRDVAALTVKLAKAHGTGSQQALTLAELERRKRGEIEALAAGFALRAQQRKKAHLSELEGWPVCWSDAKREGVKVLELLTTPIALDEAAVTCTRCKKAAELPSPEETAAFKRAEAEAAQPSPQKRKAKATSTASLKARRAKRQLRLKANLAVQLRVKGIEVKGVLRPDGTLRAQGKTHESPHAAANALAGELVSYRIDGFQAWRYQDEGGQWRMLRDHG